MDVSYHHQNTVMKGNKKKGHNKKKAIKRSSDDSLKVVYISSPMKVKTSASKFRSIVQQLTGKNSDIERYLDDDNNNNNNNNNKFGGYYEFEDEDDIGNDYERKAGVTSSEILSGDSSTPTSSDSFLGAIDDVFTTEMEEIFCLNLFCDNNEDDDNRQRMDVLGSYDDLL